eukprot:TCALIF_04983-PA protein Name:"Protein of unknown function" AED:0.65 eAED:0.65 QI:0/0/0/0.5/1/1/2/0/124
MVPAQRYVHSTKVGPRDTSDQAGIHSVPVEPTVDRSFFTGPNRALRSKAIGILALGLILAQILVCVQGSRDTVPENKQRNTQGIDMQDVKSDRKKEINSFRDMGENREWVNDLIGGYFMSGEDL